VGGRANRQECHLDRKASTLIVIAVATAIVLEGRFSRNMTVTIVGFAVLAMGLILGLLSD
jgi:hypothetical protein